RKTLTSAQITAISSINPRTPPISMPMVFTALIEGKVARRSGQDAANPAWISLFADVRGSALRNLHLRLLAQRRKTARSPCRIAEDLVRRLAAADNRRRSQIGKAVLPIRNAMS